MTAAAKSLDNPIPPNSQLAQGHLLGIEGLNPLEIAYLLDKAEGYVDHNRQVDKKLDLLKGRTQINLFYENSKG